MFVFPALFLAALAASTPASMTQDSPPQTRAVTCTLSNPSYSGYCKVTEQAPTSQSANDACQAVLSCLNDVQCLKTYCNATQVRGGWQLVSAAEGTGN
jgi:hypothetical protein